MAKSTAETIWWSLFAAGGVVAALAVPALILITGILLPFVDQGQIPGVVPFGRVAYLVKCIPGRVFLFLVVSLPLFHWANRFFHTLKDLGLHSARGLLAFLCYGSAIVGTALAVWIVLF